MWHSFITMTLPGLVGSAATILAILLSTRLRHKKLDLEIDAAQDSVWLDLVKQSRVEYALQRKENNRLRYIIHHLQEEVSDLEKKNAELLRQITSLKPDNSD